MKNFIRCIRASRFKEQIDKYLQDNNIITEHQLDSRKNYSCETAIQLFLMIGRC